MISLLKKVFGTANDRIIKKFQKEVKKINAFEESLQKLGDWDLAKKTDEFKRQLADGKSLDDILYEAFAVVREASRRVIKLRHFNVQLIGGLILHQGNITEMRTGEGKTLAATLPAYLNALTGKGVHIVTVNDYLAQRDARDMGKIFRFLGLSVGSIVSKMEDGDRRDAYQCDIVYATNNELGFDYLRDNMKYSNESKAQRELNYAIIDEVDSILIDEARTPLIISGAVDDNTLLYVKINGVVSALSESDYEKDEKTKTINLTEEGINKVESDLTKKTLIAENSSLYDFENLTLVHYVNQALKAHFLFFKDVDYILKDNKVMIIDEFTGRIMDGRRYSNGIHQAIEAKENVVIQKENQTLASITFQNYFRMYKKLSGMTGTAMTEAGELKDIYNLDVISVPTHNTSTRIDHDDAIYGTLKEKNASIMALIKECYEKGQPVLVGTVSVEKSEEISSELTKNKIPHNILNAKNHEREAYIIAQAGRFKAITIATNMAGRGTDIKLGGNPEMIIDDLQISDLLDKEYKSKFEEISKEVEDNKNKVLKAGGLFVLGTERHESRRIDNQLRGRSGRQGDIGATKFFLSLEDDLMRIFASDRISGILRTLGLKDGEAIHHPMISRSLEKAQQKVEGHNYEIRKNLLKFDNVMNDQRKVVYEQRNEIIEAKEVNNFITNMIEHVVTTIVGESILPGSYREDWNLRHLGQEMHRLFGIEYDTKSLATSDGDEETIKSELLKLVHGLYEEKINKYSEAVMNDASKYLLLTTLDHVWKDHLHMLDHLKQGISLRAYGQKDPLNEYKREAFTLFEKMLHQLQESFIQTLCYLHIDVEHINRQAMQLRNKKLQKMHASHENPSFNNYNSGSEMAIKAQPLKAYVPKNERDPNAPESWGKISRNELCPCNSGKKYKHCHGMV